MIKPPRNLRPNPEARTMERLRKAMAKVDTLAEFEFLALQASSEGSFRRMCEPMLRPGLPCCARAIKDKQDQRTDVRHSKLCPSHKLVTIH